MRRLESRRMRRSLPVVVLAVAAVLLPNAAPAAAGPPPNGLYECTLSGVGYFDDLKIKRNGKYERFGKTGKFTTKGRKMTFVTGPFAGFKGEWEKTNPPGYEIELRNPIDGFEDIYCTKN